MDRSSILAAADAASTSTPLPDGNAAAPRPCGQAILFYRLICRLARKRDPETGEPRGYAFAFCRWYAEQYGRSVRTVYEWIRQLRVAGWIETQNEEGVRVFIRPLLAVAPPRVEDTPRPKRPFAHPTPDSTLANTAGVTAGATAEPVAPPLSFTKTVTKVTEEKQGHAPATRAEPVAPPTPDPNDPVVVLMRQCQIADELIGRYLAEIPRVALEEACRYTRRRMDSGRSGGAGYAISIARNLATGSWTLPVWHTGDDDRAERRLERESAVAKRVVRAAPNKLPIPPDWLPGVPEAEARELVRDAFCAVRNGTGFAPDPFSTVVRDQARLFYQKRTGTPVPTTNPTAT